MSYTSDTMPAVIALLRAVNLGSHNKISMDALRNLCTSLKLCNPQTYVQSGNVVFSARNAKLEQIAKRLGNGIERTFGFRTDVILRTTPEMRSVVARNPFARRSGIEPGKLIVLFLANDPGPKAREAIQKIKVDQEELHLDGRELYIYFPNGMGRSRVSTAAIERAIQTPGTGRNWNSVTKLLDMAEEVEVMEL